MALLIPDSPDWRGCAPNPVDVSGQTASYLSYLPHLPHLPYLPHQPHLPYLPYLSHLSHLSHLSCPIPGPPR
jgi:hypothetical protein